MMASLDDKIAALETEIEEYRMSSRAAKTSEERKDKLIDLITESKKTLNILLAQKSQQGK
jgi:outer membrane murein-binding lipoprotein Lpp